MTRLHHLMVGAAARVIVALMVVMAASSAGADEVPQHDGFLTGRLLVATERIQDPRFARSVILMLDHDGDGALGLMLNKVYGRGPLKDLLEGFGIDAEDAESTVRLDYGGPVEPGRGFILHSPDFDGPDTRLIFEGVAMSSGKDILRAIAAGTGPSKIRILIGYAGWGPRQLEGEVARDDWVVAPADAAVVFNEDLDGLWERVMREAGVAL